jgi:SpoVK/Ycf46/Vps4 family AAA+-type ATPase
MASLESWVSNPEGTYMHESSLPRSLDDLILPVSLKRELVSFVADCKTGTQGRNDATAKRFAGGPKALFCGPPGAGKTVAAGAVAAHLGMSLERVDLFEVVGKYIGETEKNLARVFNEATAKHVVLLLDEADGLFGKRSDVKDSHDRYANLEATALSERLEAHKGVVILRSNMKSNLDSAFMRRLRFVIEFPLPSEAQRGELWKKCLPEIPELKTDDAIRTLTSASPRTGGEIRAAVEAARLKAVAEARPITIEDLRWATGG